MQSKTKTTLRTLDELLETFMAENGISEERSVEQQMQTEMSER